jgi:hypothetical protein
MGFLVGKYALHKRCQKRKVPAAREWSALTGNLAINKQTSWRAAFDLAVRVPIWIICSLRECIDERAWSVSPSRQRHRVCSDSGMDKIHIFQGFATDLSAIINNWMQANQVGTIKFVTQSESHAGTGSSLLTISIWY